METTRTTQPKLPVIRHRRASTLRRLVGYGIVR
jgi:hypothetical protein